MESVWITGADRGIGLALTEEFLRHGYRVFAGQFMPDWPELDGLRARCGGQLTVVPLDVCDDASVRRAAETVREEAGCLDILVNVAGVFGHMEEASLRRVYDTNALGPVRMVEACLPLMRGGRRRLCFFSSEAGSVSLSDRDDIEYWLAYCSSKAELNMAVRLMFNRLQPEGFSFRLYHPGGVNTYITGEKGSGNRWEPETTAPVAFRQFTEDRPFEDVLLLTDVDDRVWAF